MPISKGTNNFIKVLCFPKNTFLFKTFRSCSKLKENSNVVSLAISRICIVKNLPGILIAFLFLTCMQGQKSIEETLLRYNKGTVPYIFPAKLAQQKDYLLLDSRSWEEYQVSHIPNSFWVGYSEYSQDRISLAIPDKDTPLVVYCSVGVRSEDIGEKLLRQGYTNVKNLYGGIFQWKDQGYPVIDNSGKETQKVHAYSKQWGKLLTNAEKVY